MSVGIPGLILILLILLVLFGPKKLPELGQALGKTLKEFKNSTKDDHVDEKETDNQLK